MKTKQCASCKQVYPASLEYFYKAKTSLDGLNSWCKDCHRIKDEVRRNKDRNRSNLVTGTWTDEEERFLYNYPNMPYSEIAEKLNRTYRSVVKKIYRFDRKKYEEEMVYGIVGFTRIDLDQLEPLAIKYDIKDVDLYYIAAWYDKISTGEIAHAIRHGITIKTIDTIYSEIIKENILDRLKEEYWGLG